MTSPSTSGVETPIPAATPARTVARSLAWLTGSSLVQQLSAFVLSIVMRSLLGPARAGIWNLVQVWQDQLLNLTLGVHWVADREMPVLRAQGRTREEDEIRGITFTYLLAEAGALAIGFWVYWLVARGHWSSDEAFGLALVPVLATLNTVQFAYQLFLKNKKAFELFAWTNVVASVLDWAMVGYVLLGGLRLLLAGLVISAALRAVGYVLIVRRTGTFRIPLVVNRKLLKPLLTFGIPLSIWNLGNSLMLRLDSLVVGSALGTTALGLYFLGPQLANSLASLPTALSVISYPNMMESFGRRGVAGLEPHLRRYTEVTMLVVAPLTAAIGVFGLEVLVNVFLPAFRPGLAAMRVAVLTLLFWQAGAVFVQTLTAMKRVAVLIAVTFAAVGVQVAVIGAGALSGLTAVWAAASAVAGQAVFVVLAIWACCALLRIERSEIWRFWARLPIAGAAYLGLLLALDRLPPHATTFVPAVAVAALKLVVFTLAAAVVSLATDRHVFAATRALLRGTGSV